MALAAANHRDVSSVPIAKSQAVMPAQNKHSNPVKGRFFIRSPKDQVGPPVMQVVSELQSLSTALQIFNLRWDELQKHLDFIGNAMKSKEDQLGSTGQPKDFENVSLAVKNEILFSGAKEATRSKTAVILNDMESGNNFSKVKETTKSEIIVPKGSEAPSMVSQDAARSDSSVVRNHASKQNSSPPVATGNSSESDLETLCRTMFSRELRRYIVTHHSEASKLREEVPAALKCAPDPSRLVLECVGKFYLQGSKAFAKNSTMIPSRQAALLILEYFLLMGCCDKIDQSVNKDAEEAALAWRKRLITEGGLIKACEEDARGLLLLIACFGIPDAFITEDLIHLLRLSTAREISEALRNSSFLVGRMPDVIECMTKTGMEIGAIDTIYTFKIEDRFPPQKILASFLRSLKEACKKTRSDRIGSPGPLKEAYEKQLAALKCVMNCLEAHKVDPAKVIPGWKLNEKISNLEREILDLNKKMAFKRKSEELSHHQEFKRPRIMGETTLAVDSTFGSLQDRRVSEPLLFHTYCDPVSSYPSASSWPREYASISSTEAPPLSSERSLDHNFAGFADRGTLAYVEPLSSVGGFADRGAHAYVEPLSSVRGFADRGTHAYVEPLSSVGGFAGRSSASDLYNFADAVLEADYGRRSYQPGTSSPATSSYHSSFLY